MPVSSNCFSSQSATGDQPWDHSHISWVGDTHPVLSARRAYPALRTRYQHGVHADSPALWIGTMGLYPRLLCSDIVRSLYPSLAIAAQIHLLWNTLIITPVVLEGGVDLAQLGFGQYTISDLMLPKGPIWTHRTRKCSPPRFIGRPLLRGLSG
jgi:hypothetical protein